MDHDPETCELCTESPLWASPRDVALALPRPLATLRRWARTGQVRTDRTTGRLRVDWWQARCLDARIHLRPNATKRVA